MRVKKMLRLCAFALCVVGAGSVVITGCVHSFEEDMSQEDGYKAIKTDYENKDWGFVNDQVAAYKVRYPYSKYITELELMQADSFFQSHKYAEAVFAYEDYIRKYPTAKNLDLAYFRIAQSYDAQSPENVGRDQSNTQKAMDRYKQSMELFPSSQYTTASKERFALLEQRLAQSRFFVGEFYLRKSKYSAALSTFLDIMGRFKHLPDAYNRAKKSASVCYNELAKQLEKKPDSDASVFFRNETPQGLRAKAQTVLTM